MLVDPESVFTPEALAELRAGIAARDGNECLFQCEHDGRRISAVRWCATGNRRGVPMVLHDFPAAHWAHVHNHPSGTMTPSDADILLAARFAVPAFIVNNPVNEVFVMVPMRECGADYFWGVAS